MSHRNRTGLYALTIASLAAFSFAGCGGLDKVKLVITPDAGSGGTDQSEGGNGSAGHPSGANSGNSNGGGSVGDSGNSGAGEPGSQAGDTGDGGEGGQMPIPDPMPGPPTVTTVFPRDKATGAEVNTPIRVNFSEPLDPSTVTDTTVVIKDDLNQVVPGKLTYADAVATFNPTRRLNLLGNYTVQVSVGVQDLTHTPLAAPFSSSFSVRDGVWTKAETSLTTSTAGFDLQSSLELASDHAGHAMAAWIQASDTTTTYDVYTALFTEGSGWGRPVKVNANAVYRYVDVSMNSSGNAIVAWLEYDSAAAAYSVNARRYVAGNWDPAPTRMDITLPTSTYTVYPEAPTVAMSDKGDAHVAWYSWYYDSIAKADYYGAYTRHVDATGAWSSTLTTLTYSQVGSGMSRPSLAFDASGNGFVAFQYTAGSPAKVNTVVERYIASTAKWGVTALNSPAADGYAQSVSVATNPAGQAVVAWVRTTGTSTSTDDLLGSYFDKAWSTPATISTATTTISTPATSAWTGKSFLVAWSQSGGTPFNVYASEYTTSWSKAAIVSDGNHSAGTPWLAGDSRGNALLIWPQQSDTAATTTLIPIDVFFSRFTGSTEKWSDGHAATSAIAGYRYPRVQVLGDGTAVAGFQSTMKSFRPPYPVTGVFQNGFQ